MALSHSGLRRKAQAVRECPSFSSILLEQTVTRCSCLLSASPQWSYMEVELLKVSRSWGERCILSHTPITDAAASGCGPKCIQWDLFSKVIFVTERWNARNNKGALKTTSADKDRQDYWKRLVSHLGKGSPAFRCLCGRSHGQTVAFQVQGSWSQTQHQQGATVLPVASWERK